MKKNHRNNEINKCCIVKFLNRWFAWIDWIRWLCSAASAPNFPVVIIPIYCRSSVDRDTVKLSTYWPVLMFWSNLWVGLYNKQSNVIAGQDRITLQDKAQQTKHNSSRICRRWRRRFHKSIHRLLLPTTFFVLFVLTNKYSQKGNKCPLARIQTKRVHIA